MQIDYKRQGHPGDRVSQRGGAPGSHTHGNIHVMPCINICILMSLFCISLSHKCGMDREEWKFFHFSIFKFYFEKVYNYGF
jgi:hypothetical protein